MTFEAKFNKALEILVKACEPRKIILFGSRARGDATEDSDIDLMIVEDAVSDAAIEMTRLSRELSKIKFYADLVVTSQSYFDYWRDTPGNVYFEANLEGKVVYEKTA